MIAQRLFSGRVAVAQAALAYRKSLYDSTQVGTWLVGCRRRRLNSVTGIHPWRGDGASSLFLLLFPHPFSLSFLSWLSLFISLYFMFAR